MTLAFDFGTKRIGVAVGSGGIAGATELQALSAKDGIPNWEAVGRLIEQWQPVTAVVGLPCNMDGSESEMTLRARKFGNRIKGRFSLPVHFVDERLTTRAAREEIGSRRELDGMALSSLDTVAARLILEDWFRQQQAAQQ